MFPEGVEIAVTNYEFILEPKAPASNLGASQDDSPATRRFDQYIVLMIGWTIGNLTRSH